MSENSKIEWTDQTFNPWWGCTKISPGCENCYAATFAARYRVGWGPKAARRIASENYWEKPLKWDKQAQKEGRRMKVFCASMADVFEDRRDLDHARCMLWRVIRQTPNLDWLILTKRPELVNSMAPREWTDEHLGSDGWPANVWLGTSVENQVAAESRIPALLRTGARVKFLSLEPLIGPVEFGGLMGQFGHDGTHCGDGSPGCPRAPHHHHDEKCKCPIDWFIVGGESGWRSRPMDIAWARRIKRQVEFSGGAFFMKQLGGKVDKRGRLSDLPEDLQIREFPV